MIEILFLRSLPKACSNKDFNGNFDKDVNMLEKAIEITRSAFGNMPDKVGKFAVLHPLAVSEDPELVTEDEKTVAVLHDTVEDTYVTLEGLRKDFPEHIVEAVDAITKRDGETYTEYLGRVSQNKLALKVKKADIRHNLSRLDGLDETEREYLTKKYHRAKKILGIE